MRHVGYLLELHRDARSPEYKKDGYNVRPSSIYTLAIWPTSLLSDGCGNKFPPVFGSAADCHSLLTHLRMRGEIPLLAPWRGSLLSTGEHLLVVLIYRPN